MPHQHLKALTLLAVTQCFQPPQKKSHQSVLLHAKGRGRAAKYHERRDAEQKYATRLLGLLTHERKEEERAHKQRERDHSDEQDAHKALVQARLQKRKKRGRRASLVSTTFQLDAREAFNSNLKEGSSETLVGPRPPGGGAAAS